MRKIKFYWNWDLQSIPEDNRFTGTLRWIIDYLVQSIASNTEKYNRLYSVIDYLIHTQKIDHVYTIDYTIFHGTASVCCTFCYYCSTFCYCDDFCMLPLVHARMIAAVRLRMDV